MKKEYKVIQLSPTHYLFVDDSEIKEGDWFYHSSHGKSQIKRCEAIVGKSIVIDKGDSSCWVDYSKKITHSTQQLEGVKHIPLSEVEEAIFGYSVDSINKMSHEHVTDIDYSQFDRGVIYGFHKGFKAHQELSKDKVFTLEDIEEAFNEGVSYGIDKGVPFEKYKKKLLPKKEWCVKFDEQGKLKLV